MIIYLNAKSKDGRYVINSDGKRKEYPFYSATVKQSWFDLASAQINLSLPLSTEEQKLIFVLREDEIKVFEGCLIKRCSKGSGEEIHLVNFIQNRKDRSTLGMYLKKSNALREIPLIASPNNQNQRSFFDAQGKVFSSITPLEKQVLTNQGSTRYKVNATFSYTLKVLQKTDFSDELFGEGGFLANKKLPSQIIDGWPREGSSYDNVQVISSEIRNYQSTTNGPWISRGKLEFQQTILVECFERWVQIINPIRKESVVDDVVHVNLQIDLGQVLDNIEEWEAGRKYYSGTKVAYKSSEADWFQFFYCKKPHIASGTEPDIRYWDVCGDGSLLKEDFLFKSDFGKKLYTEIMAHVLLDLWSQAPEAMLHLTACTKDVANVCIGDTIIMDGNQYTVVSYQKEYSAKSTTKIIAYKMPLEKVYAALNRKHPTEYIATLIQGPKIEEELTPRCCLKFYFPKSLQKTVKVVKIGDLNV